MKAIKQLYLACILSCSAVWAGVAEAQAAAAVQPAKRTEMASQQELVDLFLAAAKIGNQEVIQEFLKHGFPVDVKNGQGYTALMMATYYGHQETVTTLLKHGADRCLRDNKGNTALMGALFKMEFSIAKQLSQVDCDTQAKQTGQKTTAEFAKVIGQEKQLQKIIAAQEKKRPLSGK